MKGSTCSPNSSDPATLDARILEEAADWLMRMHSGALSDAERAAFARWRERSPKCGQAWARAERLLDKLHELPPSLAMRALDRPVNPRRRAAVTKLAVLLAIAPAGWAAWRLAPWQAWSATYRTAVGERREIRLVDGSRITLNTDSAADVRFDAAQRLILLRAGEILVATAPDPAPVHRPFRVEMAQGRLEALGTRFDVRQLGDWANVAVFEGAVRVEPRNVQAALPRIVHAGEQAAFTANTVSQNRPAADAIEAWTNGMLVADKMRLIDFAAELARYRHGVVRCDPAIAELPVSGAFPVTDAERALAMLSATYAVDAVVRTPYWITLRPRAVVRQPVT